MNMFRQQTRSLEGEASRHQRGLRQHLRTNPFLQTAVLGLAGLVGVAGASLYASRQAGEGEATTDVRVLTDVVAHTVLEPNLTDGVIQGDPDEIARFDAIVRERVLTDDTVRVKLWDDTGRIVYSDEPRLIGEVYEFEGDQLEVFENLEVISEVSSVEGEENRFETEFGDLLEVYLPVWGPNGDTLLYEAYFQIDGVEESTGRIFRALAPIVIGSLAGLQLLHLFLAWHMSRWLQRGQREREMLLQRALDSSDAERRRIAADLHDGAVQELVGTSYALTAASRSAADVSPGLSEDLSTASTGVLRSLQSLRSLLVEIYPPSLAEHGLEVALNDLLAPIRTSGVRAEVEYEVQTEPDIPVAGLVYRVTQEAVRNAVRHADADAIAVAVSSHNGTIVASVSDDGRGFDTTVPMPESHFGLRLMRDVAEQAEGTLSVTSAAGSGTSVTLEVPR